MLNNSNVKSLQKYGTNNSKSYRNINCILLWACLFSMIGYSSSRPSGTAGSSPWAARARSTSAWLEVDALMMDFEICVDEGHGHFSRPKQKNETEIMHTFTKERLQVACVLK
jgi:hypothetical protein